jgi:hypothetical protein
MRAHHHIQLVTRDSQVFPIGRNGNGMRLATNSTFSGNNSFRVWNPNLITILLNHCLLYVGHNFNSSLSNSSVRFGVLRIAEFPSLGSYSQGVKDRAGNRVKQQRPFVSMMDWTPAAYN